MIFGADVPSGAEDGAAVPAVVGLDPADPRQQRPVDAAGRRRAGHAGRGDAVGVERDVGDAVRGQPGDHGGCGRRLARLLRRRDGQGDRAGGAPFDSSGMVSAVPAAQGSEESSAFPAATRAGFSGEAPTAVTSTAIPARTSQRRRPGRASGRLAPGRGAWASTAAQLLPTMTWWFPATWPMRRLPVTVTHNHGFLVRLRPGIQGWQRAAPPSERARRIPAVTKCLEAVKARTLCVGASPQVTDLQVSSIVATVIRPLKSADRGSSGAQIVLPGRQVKRRAGGRHGAGDNPQARGSSRAPWRTRAPARRSGGGVAQFRASPSIACTAEAVYTHGADRPC